MYKIEHKAIIITPPMKIDLFFLVCQRPVLKGLSSGILTPNAKRAKKGQKKD